MLDELKLFAVVLIGGILLAPLLMPLFEQQTTDSLSGSTDSLSSSSETYFEESIRLLQEGHTKEGTQMWQQLAEMEELLEKVWNEYRITNDYKLREILEENRDLAPYVINGEPLRELLDKYPHRPD